MKVHVKLRGNFDQGILIYKVSAKETAVTIDDQANLDVRRSKDILPKLCKFRRTVLRTGTSFIRIDIVVVRESSFHQAN